MAESALAPRRTAMSAAAAAVLHVAGAFVMLAVTPALVGSLGLEAFGLWALVGSLVRYVGLSDVGIAHAYFKFVPNYAMRGEHDRIRQIVTFGLIFYSALGLAFGPLAWLSGRALARAFHVSPALATALPDFLGGFVALFFLALGTGTLGMMLTGLGHLRVTALVTAIGQIVFALFAVGLARSGFGLLAFDWAMLAQLGVTGVLSYVAVRRIFGPILISPFRFEPGVIAGLFRFGAWLQLSAIAGLINSESDRVVIGLFFGVPAVGLYEIGSKLARAIRALSWYFFNAFAPVTAALEASGDEAGLRASYRSGNRYISLISLVAIGFVIAASAPILGAWMGPAYAQNGLLVAIVAVLGITHTIEIFTGAGTMVMRARGTPRFETYASVVYAGVNVVLTIVLGRAFGIVGVLVATLLGSIAGTTFFTIIFHQRERIAFWESSGTWLWRLMLAVASSAGITALTLRALGLGYGNRFADLAILALSASVYAILTAIALRAVAFFGPADLGVATRLLPARARRFVDVPAIRVLFTGGAR